MESIITLFQQEKQNTELTRFLHDNYEVESFNRGLDAFVHIQTGHIPNLIITEERLTDISLQEFISTLKNSGYFSEIPILILSETSDSAYLRALLKSGADDVVLRTDIDLVQISVRNILLKQK